MVFCFTDEETRKQQAQGLKAGNWLGRIPRQGPLPTSSLACLGQAGLTGWGWVQESNKRPGPVAVWSLSPPLRPSAWAITSLPSGLFLHPPLPISVHTSLRQRNTTDHVLLWYNNLPLPTSLPLTLVSALRRGGGHLSEVTMTLVFKLYQIHAVKWNAKRPGIFLRGGAVLGGASKQMCVHWWGHSSQKQFHQPQR